MLLAEVTIGTNEPSPGNLCPTHYIPNFLHSQITNKMNVDLYWLNTCVISHFSLYCLPFDTVRGLYS
jgi:hypothetical protein